MNDMRILGNLTKDPTIRETNNGRVVASFSVAMNRDYVTPQGEKKQLTDYVNVVVWGNLAIAVQQNLMKGRRVYVEGRLSTRSYEDKSGQKRYVTEVVASIIALPLSAQQGGNQQGYQQNVQNNGNFGGYRPQQGYQGMNTQPNGQNGYGGGYNQNFGQWGNGQGGSGPNAAPNNAPNWNQYGPDVPQEQSMFNGHQNKDEDIPF